MLLRRSIGLVWLARKPHTAPAVSQITGLHQENLAPGTHLVTSRRGYMHHGIYVGRGMVVHYAGLSRFLRSGPVEEVMMSRFSMGRAVRTIEYSESKYSPQEIVRRARSRLGENDYQVLRNNCEHFCNWCVSGRSHSTQVESLLASTLRALVIAVDCTKRLSLMLGNLPAAADSVVPMRPKRSLVPRPLLRRAGRGSRTTRISEAIRESWVSSTKCAASSKYSAP